MRDYEIVYIFHSSLTSEEIEAKLERYHAIITADGPGDVTATVHWGKRRLAYPIRKQRNGHYVVAQFTSSPDPLVELERVLKLEDDVLRYLIVIAEQPLPVPETTPTVPAAEEAGAEEAAAEETASEPGDGAEAAADAEAGTEGDTEEPVGDADEADEVDAAEEADEVEEAGAADEADEADEVDEGDEAEADDTEADAEPDGAGADAGEPDESADAKEE